MRRLATEHLVGEVVHDVAVVAGEGSDERRGVGASPNREGRQLQCRDPPSVRSPVPDVAAVSSSAATSFR